MSCFGAQISALGSCFTLAVTRFPDPNTKTSLIARFMGATWAHLGPTGPRWAPCWPHELCYLECYMNRWLTPVLQTTRFSDRIINSLYICHLHQIRFMNNINAVHHCYLPSCKHLHHLMIWNNGMLKDVSRYSKHFWGTDKNKKWPLEVPRNITIYRQLFLGFSLAQRKQIQIH